MNYQDPWIQRQLSLVVVGIAFLIASLVFGVGTGLIFYKQCEIERQIQVGFAYAQDVAEARQIELQRSINGTR